MVGLRDHKNIRTLVYVDDVVYTLGQPHGSIMPLRLVFALQQLQICVFIDDCRQLHVHLLDAVLDLRRIDMQEVLRRNVCFLPGRRIDRYCEDNEQHGDRRHLDSHHQIHHLDK